MLNYFWANLSVWLARSNQWLSVFIDSCSGGEDNHFNQLSCFSNPQVLFLRTPLKRTKYHNRWSLSFSHPYCDYYADGHNNVTSVFTFYPFLWDLPYKPYILYWFILTVWKYFQNFGVFVSFSIIKTPAAPLWACGRQYQRLALFSRIPTPAAAE